MLAHEMTESQGLAVASQQEVGRLKAAGHRDHKTLADRKRKRILIDIPPVDEKAGRLEINRDHLGWKSRHRDDSSEDRRAGNDDRQQRKPAKHAGECSTLGLRGRAAPPGEPLQKPPWPSPGLRPPSPRFAGRGATCTLNAVYCPSPRLRRGEPALSEHSESNGFAKRG